MSSYVLTVALLVGIVLIGLASKRHSACATLALLSLVVVAPAVVYLAVA